jgi:hypothetical protein
MNSSRFRIPIIAALVLGACSSAPQGKPDVTVHGPLRRSDLEIVDCELPGQIRQLGTMTYQTQRRPVRTISSDCRVRGGLQVAFDRADLQTALHVWQQAADGGDAEAQTTVGEIYERGMGVPPDFQAAAAWYQRAADQHYSRALFSLGSLYDQGRGVSQDKLRALDLYRQAWGLPADSVIYQSAAQREQQALRAELEQQLADKDNQLKLLQSQIERLQKDMHQASSSADANAHKAQESQAQIDGLKSWVARLEGERRDGSERLASLSQLRTPTTVASVSAALPEADPRSYAGMNFGRYYALVIGNQHYSLIESLQTPIGDAERAAKVLRDKYGFTVQIIKDADDVAMLKALNDLKDTLKPEDNLLIYYAGHGVRLQVAASEAGYWLPVNSEPPPRDTFWIPNTQITAHLARLPARRILVVADSCYAGLLAADPGYLFIDSKAGYTHDYISYKLPKRSRLLISSGGDHPVLDTDAGGGSNSVFGRAFLDELDANNGVLSSPELFGRVSRRVEAAAALSHFVEKPKLESIKEAGHEMGDFFFVPVALSQQLVSKSG